MASSRERPRSAGRRSKTVWARGGRDGEYGPEEIQSDIASDIYGAYYDFLSGENVDFSGALWDLWNAVLFDIENLPGNEDALIKALAEQNAEQVAELAAGMRTPG